MPDDLLVTDRGSIRTLTINRPTRRNALTPHLSAEMAGVLTAAGKDQAVRLVVIRGAGGHFSAGLDLHWVSEMGSGLSKQALQTGMRQFQSIIHAVTATPVPVVAALEGTVAGFGLDLALACDVRYADPNAKLTSAFARMGLVPDGGSTSTLPKLIGQGRAFRFLVDGSVLDAVKALKYGMVDKVTQEGGLDEALKEFAGAIQRSSRHSVGAIKNLVERHNGSGWTDTLNAEGMAQLKALGSEDFRDRLNGFVSRKGKAKQAE